MAKRLRVLHRRNRKAAKLIQKIKKQNRAAEKLVDWYMRRGWLVAKQRPSLLNLSILINNQVMPLSDWQYIRVVVNENEQLVNIIDEDSQKSLQLYALYECAALKGKSSWSKHFRYRRQVADTTIGSTRISTVFLLLGYSKSPFETMVFSDDDELDQYQNRYMTWEEARVGHRKLVQEIRSGVSPKRARASEFKDQLMALSGDEKLVDELLAIVES